MNNNIKNFSKDVIIVTLGQLLILFCSLIQNLLIPKYLTTEEYGLWQLFLLYCLYVGFLHLGFLDGLLLKWAGKKWDDINGEIKIAFPFLVFEQIVVGMPLFVIVLFFFTPPARNIIEFALVFGIVTNIFYFFLFIFQATKKFKFTSIINVSKVGIFTIFIIILLFTDELNYSMLIVCNIFSALIILVICMYIYRHYLYENPITAPLSLLRPYGIKNTRNGFFVMLGFYETTFIISVDRILVGVFFPISQFAYYSFAVSMLGLIYIFIQTTSQVIFPYLCESLINAQVKIYLFGKKTLILLWGSALTIYFPLIEFIKIFLPQYTYSLPIFQILICNLSFNLIIILLHINFFKILQNQRVFSIIAFFSGLFLITLTSFVIKTGGSISDVALITVICSGMWYLINEFYLNKLLNIPNKEIILGLSIIGVYFSIFWLSSQISSQIVVQTIFYLCLSIFFSLIIFKLEIKTIIQILKQLTGL